MIPLWLNKLTKYSIRLDHPTEYRLLKQIGEGAHATVRLA